MADFTQSNPALEAKIAACTTKEQLADVLRAHQEANGLPTQYDRYAVPARTQSAKPSVETPKDNGRTLRKAITLDDGTVKLIEADSFYGLDILEAAVRGKRI